MLSNIINTIIKGDCIEELKKIPSNSIDLIFADPPYNMQLKNEIKQRDNYTCQIFGLSVKEEPNLLLEIDHIIPLSKNGITSEDNLQTLCWRCNRSKSNKIF